MQFANPTNNSKTTSHSSQPTSTSGLPVASFMRAVALLLMVGLLIGGSYFTSSASFSSKVGQSQDPALSSPGRSAGVIPFNSLPALRSTSLAPFSSLLSSLLLPPPVQQSGPTIEVFAADCTTPQTAFAAGETICAKTDGVDLTIPGNYYVNWFHPDNSATNGGTITTNPQYTLFSIPTSGSYLGTWKANIGRVEPAESSIIGNPPLFTVSAAQTIATFAWDTILLTCTNTPKTNFVVGETVCARAVGVDPAFNRRFAWVDANGVTREFTPITTDPATDDYALLLTETSLGTWKANVVSSRGTTVVGTPFTVAGITPSVDLSIAKALSSGELKSGEDATFTIAVYNRGPSDAENVVITDETPANATFVSAGQTVGSGFSCTGTTTVTCTGAILKAGDTAVFEFVYTAGAAGQTITNTATVESDTPEVVAGEDTDGDTIDDASEDNSSTAGPYTIGQGNGGGGDCELTCPSDITATANTTENGQFGANVNYAPAQSTGTCGTITYSHASGSFFPVGDTAVTATSETGGGSCTFTIRVEEAGNTTISCPPNKTADAGANCDAQVDPGTPTATGTNVTISGVRSDGRPLNARYPVGTTTITWTATSHDAQGGETGNASCTQTIEVTGAEDTTPPTVTAPADSSASADSNCQAAVPDYAAGSTASDNCGSTPTLTQSPEAGTLVGTGPHTVTVTATDDAGNQGSDTVVFTVNDTTAPTVTAPADSSASGDANCQAAVPDYTANSTATDNCDTSLTITQDPAPGTMVSGSGPHTVTVSSTDDAGNTGSDTVIFTVNDVTAPTITAPPDSSASADDNCLAPVPDYTATSTTSDNCDSNLTVTQSPEAGTMVGKGPHTVTVTATDDAGNSSNDAVVFTVNDTTAPVISCPANVTANTAPGTCSAAVVPGTATATDNCDSTPTITATRSDGQPLVALYPKGTTTITWRATDDDGNYSECAQTVTVVDNEAPVITFNGVTPSMWPPSHNYRTFTNADFISSVSDNCDSLSVNDVDITHVTSDEAEESLTLGDGTTFNDMVIAADCKSVQLRAERVNSGNGRVYTIHFKLVDSSGNVTTGTAKVHSPRNQNSGAVDDGPVYTVTGSCP